MIMTTTPKAEKASKTTSKTSNKTTSKTSSKKASNATGQLEQLIAQIAQDHLFIDTLETRNRDSLDFHDTSVWGIQSALMAAYQAGLAAGQKAQPKAAD